MMMCIAEGTFEELESLLYKLGKPSHHIPYYRKWLSQFLRYCRASNLPAHEGASLLRFSQGMSERGLPSFQIGQARYAVNLYWEHGRKAGAPQPAPAPTPASAPSEARPAPAVAEETISDWVSALKALDDGIRFRHYSPKTLKSYHHWIRTFRNFLPNKTPPDLNCQDAKAFLTHLAVNQHVSASTQNIAFSALLFFYTEVLKKDFSGMEDTPRAKRRHNVPVVMTRNEVAAVLARLEYPYDLFTGLLYGCGLRLQEALALRVQDLDFELERLVAYHGKGAKSRRVPLPAKLIPTLRGHLESVRRTHEEDLRVGTAGVFLPEALERKYPNAAREWPFQWVFPASRLTAVPEQGELRRFHLHETSAQKEIYAAVKASGIGKKASAHSFRHSYATHLLQMGYDIRTVQELLGHNDVATTMIYTHAVQTLAGRVISPMDA